MLLKIVWMPYSFFVSRLFLRCSGGNITKEPGEYEIQCLRIQYGAKFLLTGDNDNNPATRIT